MSIVKFLKATAVVATLAGLSACATAPAPKDYSALRREAPHSILVVPALNNTVSVTAPDFFLSTVSQPFGERGYYIYPANMIRGLLQENGLSDAGLVHHADPKRLGDLFGCDAVLFIDIDKWDSKYVIISTTTEVAFKYELKSCKTGEVLWDKSEEMVYKPQSSSTGNILGDLVAAAIVAAIEKGKPNYMPLARQANLAAATLPGQGLPAGPYLSSYNKDTKVFPSH